MKKAAFHNLGCKVNSYEMDVMQQIVQNSGYEIVQFTQKADVYIVNTCTVTSIADRKSRQMLHRAKALNPEAVVVAVGCYAQTGLEDLKKDTAVDIIIGNNHKTEIGEILNSYFKEHEERIVSMSDLSLPTDYENSRLSVTSGRTRADVKIQDGCNQFCAYCAIPLARGRVRSRKPEEVIAEIETLIGNGYKEVVLTGIHISSYGIDFDDEAWSRGDIKPSSHTSLTSGDLVRDYNGESKLFDLLEMIEEKISLGGSENEPVSTDFRIRLGSFEPRVVTRENVSRMVKLPHICPHFHLSLQSGCDATLKRMNRRYTAEEYAVSVEILRNIYQQAGIPVAITTDVIVGFPGETDEEFDITREYLEKLKLYEMHIFKYSRRKNTVADKLPDQVPDGDKDRRSDVLLDMTARHSKEYRQQAIGRECKILLEECKKINGQQYAVGHTGDYILVAVPAETVANPETVTESPADISQEAAVVQSGISEENISGRIISVKIMDFLTDEILLGQ